MSKSNKVRVSNHVGRGSARHNGRGFDLEKAEHIDASRTQQNMTWAAIVGDDGQVRMRKLSQRKAQELEALEKQVYEARFRDGLDAQNDKYCKRRQYKYCKTMDDVYQGQHTQPVEMIMQIGDKTADTPLNTFARAEIDWLNWLVGWNAQHGNHLQLLSNSIHGDEVSPHAHVRMVWACDGPDGATISQDKAMEQAGLELPNPGAKRSKYNNRAQTFTAMCREKWIEICQGYGFDVEMKAVPGRKHRSKEDFQAEQESAKMKELEAREKAVVEREAALDGREAALEGRERLLKIAEGSCAIQTQRAVEGLKMAQKALAARGRNTSDLDKALAGLTSNGADYSRSL